MVALSPNQKPKTFEGPRVECEVSSLTFKRLECVGPRLQRPIYCGFSGEMGALKAKCYKCIVFPPTFLSCKLYRAGSAATLFLNT